MTRNGLELKTTTFKESNILIYYRISEAGMFQLFTHRIYHILTSSLHSILVNNGSHSIFETFLYPYFRKETLTITETNYGIRVDIINYLNACCTLAYSLMTTPYEERITSLKVFENYMSVLGNELVMKILLYFGANVKGMDGGKRLGWPNY